MLSDPLILRDAWDTLGTRMRTRARTHIQILGLPRALSPEHQSKQCKNRIWANKWIFMTQWVCVCVCLYQRRGKSKLWVRKRRNKRITRFRAERGQDIRRGQEVEWYRSSHNSLGSRCTCYLLPPLQLYTPPPYMIQPSSSLISITSRITLPFMTISLMWIHSGGSFLWRIIAMSWVFITK